MRPLARHVAVVVCLAAGGAVRAQHWAYAPLARPTPPAIAAGAWGMSPIDAFVAARSKADDDGNVAREATHGERDERIMKKRRGRTTPAPPTSRDSPCIHARLVERQHTRAPCVALRM